MLGDGSIGEVGVVFGAEVAVVEPVVGGEDGGTVEGLDGFVLSAVVAEVATVVTVGAVAVVATEESIGATSVARGACVDDVGRTDSGGWTLGRSVLDGPTFCLLAPV